MGGYPKYTKYVAQRRLGGLEVYTSLKAPTKPIICVFILGDVMAGSEGQGAQQYGKEIISGNISNNT